MVSKTHIDSLVQFASKRGIDCYWNKIKERREPLPPNLLGEILWEANRKSVNCRYTEDIKNEPYNYQAVSTLLTTPIQIIKSCGCLNYQSSDSDDWENSLAKDVLDKIMNEAITELPGYEEAVWGI